MKRNKKKGFTLVELIAALAILTAGVTVVYSAFMTSTKIFVREKTNLELVSSNQSIAENLKAEGKIRVENIVTQVGDVTHPVNAVYIFFDNYDEIHSDINDKTGNLLTGETGGASYAKCKAVNESNLIKKKQGALLLISKKDLTISTYAVYSYYQIDVTVWDFNSGNKSQTTFYIGR